MCTFNIALDDELVKTVRHSFSDEESFTAWMQEQITVLLTHYVPVSENKEVRRKRKYDSLMGVSGAIEHSDWVKNMSKYRILDPIDDKESLLEALDERYK